MTMKSIIVVAALATVGIAYAQFATSAKSEDARAEREAHRQARIAAEGGSVKRPLKGRVVRFMVKTDKISIADVEEQAAQLRKLLRIEVQVINSESATKNATGALVILAEQEKAPTLLVAPEDLWATVNVSNLAADKPSAEVLRSRIIKELWRALAYALGGGNSPQPPCVMRPICKPSDLDREKCQTLSPGPLMAISKTAKELGFARGGYVTYKTAVVEGWAAQPTNAVQKAIWDEIHSVPTKPITIEPEKK